jgi:hypothetical protein
MVRQAHHTMCDPTDSVTHRMRNAGCALRDRRHAFQSAAPDHASPCVEVLSPRLGLAPYHRLALANSVQVWRSANEPIDRAGTSPDTAASGASQATALVGG